MLKVIIIFVSFIVVAVAGVFFVFQPLTTKTKSQVVQQEIKVVKSPQKKFYVYMKPFQSVSSPVNNADTGILRPYLQVKSKQASKEICRLMPLLRDSFIMALNEIRMRREKEHSSIDSVFKKTATRVLPKDLLLDIVVFDTNNSKDFYAEKKLTTKIKCKVKKKDKKKDKKK